MNEAERRLSEDRAVRRSARGLFDKRLAQVKADYEARGLADRVKAKAADEGKKALGHAADVASESKGIIAGTLAALALWFFRGPILAFAERLFKPRQDQVQDQTDSAASEMQE